MFWVPRYACPSGRRWYAVPDEGFITSLRGACMASNEAIQKINSLDWIASSG
ncbi:MAG: hypothetical protein LBK53_00585 [Heliobacteriaceae bacterium]|nr:hypothetical protein [Heliobacteriaceae bacterium]